jgi:LPXTG-site transpeptidase (sortase) family protein
VSSPSTRQRNNKKIPLGVVFFVVGIIIIGTVLMILVVSPYQVPEGVSVYSELALTRIPSTIFQVEKGLLAAESNEAQLPILLPESPTDTTDMPSIASLAEAPTSPGTSDSRRPYKLVIPSLDIDVEVSRVSLVPQEKDGQRVFQWQVPAGYQVGWHENSALLGQPGNTVLNGHNNVYGEVFRNLIDLSIGESIVIHDAVSAHTYEVVQKEILPERGQPISVRRLNARWIEPTRDERITLITCWPYATNSHRLVVIAKPIDEQ